MNVNFGLMPPLPGRWKRADRKKGYTDRARAALAEWLTSIPPCGEAVGRGTMQSMVEG
jgi:methylenetetrahydrofolate--tRNA-(uracil-5-)-methyltransferase